MEQEEVTAHLDYYRRLNEELVASGELVGGALLTGPDLAKVVASDGVEPVITDGPFQEFKEWIAGYQIVQVRRSSARSRSPPWCRPCPAGRPADPAADPGAPVHG